MRDLYGPVCGEEVLRGDDDREPCEHPAVGWRLDDESQPYPVCVTHHRWPYADELVAARDTIRRAGDQVRRLLEADQHVVELREDGFGLSHGLPCRGDLIGCPVNRGLEALDGPPAPPGRYHVALDPTGGAVRVGALAGDYDPLVAGLTDVLTRLEKGTRP